MSAIELKNAEGIAMPNPVIGVFSPGDYRVSADDRERCRNIVQMVADRLASDVKLPNGDPVKVVYSRTLVDGEPTADIVAAQFIDAGVNILVCVPDTWSFPQPTAISFVSHFPKDTPLNITCGNSGPKPGVVYAHALVGAYAQCSRLCHLNVGSWPDRGMNPVMKESTAKDLIDWCYAAVTYQYFKGKRICVFGHDAMGMETALQHVIPTRNTFGLEICRTDMKVLSDLYQMEAYDKEELKALRNWIETKSAKINFDDESTSELFDKSLSLYLIVRDYLKSMNAVGGGFMNQLEWASLPEGKIIPLPVMDVAESLFNSTFDHNGPKKPTPFATEADNQALLTMLIFSALTAGKSPLFMDFRKVWEPWQIKEFAAENGYTLPEADWVTRGFVDGNNSGSAGFDWAGKPGDSVDDIMKNVSYYPVDHGYFRGGGNCCHFLTPGGISGIAGRIMYSELSGMFSMSWDEAVTADITGDIAEGFMHLTDYTWPHTFVMPKYATMTEYKQLPPANHFHMVEGLNPARLEYWMDLANVLSQSGWTARPKFIEGVDRPTPLIYVANGGEDTAKMLLKK